MGGRRAGGTMMIRTKVTGTLLLALAMAAVTSASSTDGQRKASAAGTIALTPPMGWNSWNKFGCDVSDALIRQIADAMVSSGMRQAGYQYIIIDDCWQVSRSGSGEIITDPVRFPEGMQALADYIHSRGLKFGIYTDAGTLTCQKRPGSLGHEQQDIDTYASWGVDYLKIDWCNAEGLDPEAQYAKFHAAIRAAERPMVLSICNWGFKASWRWGARVGNLWRTSGDISDSYDAMAAIGFSQNGLERFAGPGHWNDPDMLEVGNGGMTPDEYRTHFGLWALLAAPLLAGNDLRHMDAETIKLLTNTEIIAVDQDSRGAQGRRVWQEGPLEIWAKSLADGTQAVGLFNRTDFPAQMNVDLRMLGLLGSAHLRDLWQHRDLGAVRRYYTAAVPRHGMVMLKISAD